MMQYAISLRWRTFGIIYQNHTDKDEEKLDRGDDDHKTLWFETLKQFSDKVINVGEQDPSDNNVSDSAQKKKPPQWAQNYSRMQDNPNGSSHQSKGK